MKKQRLSKQEWLAKALEIVSAEGGQRLRVEDLVRKMGVSQGSFYWHFKNRQDFVKSLANHWVEFTNPSVMGEVERRGGDAGTRLLNIIDVVFRGRHRKYDLTFRAWGQTDPTVRKVVRKVDRQRLDYVGALFREMGFAEEKAMLRTRMFVAFVTFETLLTVDISKKERIESIPEIHAFLTRK